MWLATASEVCTWMERVECNLQNGRLVLQQKHECVLSHSVYLEMEPETVWASGWLLHGEVRCERGGSEGKERRKDAS